MNEEERIAKELHHLIENRIQHAYESGFSDGTKKTQELIRQLEQFTEVRIKDNLDRILKTELKCEVPWECQR